LVPRSPQFILSPYILMNDYGGVGPWISSIYYFPYSFGKCNVGLRNKIFKGFKCLPGSHQEIVQYLSEFFYVKNSLVLMYVKLIHEG
jgi:hypothetical protein